jgi:SHS2 domain-containing protein
MKKKPKNENIKFTEHTADIGIEVKGATIKELFENSGLGVFRIIANTEKIKSSKQIKIKTEEENLELLLVRFLQEIVYKSETEEIAFKDICVDSIKQVGKSWEATALLKGEPFKTAKEKLRTQIKAVTYHNLNLKKTRTGYQAGVIFDV